MVAWKASSVCAQNHGITVEKTRWALAQPRTVLEDGGLQSLGSSFPVETTFPIRNKVQMPALCKGRPGKVLLVFP